MPIETAPEADVSQEKRGFPSSVSVIGPELVINPAGFAQQNSIFTATGEESDVLEGLRSRGWSNEAIEALKNGKTLKRTFTPTPFGVVSQEQWAGKEEAPKE